MGVSQVYNISLQLSRTTYLIRQGEPEFFNIRKGNSMSGGHHSLEITSCNLEKQCGEQVNETVFLKRKHNGIDDTAQVATHFEGASWGCSGPKLCAPSALGSIPMQNTCRWCLRHLQQALCKGIYLKTM